MNNQPKVSVCIPVYNGEKHIEQTVRSILDQTHRSLSLTVIDNCSTDDTVRLVSSFDDERITLIKNDENVGMVGNFNRCLEHNDCDYLYILCADDLIEKECLQKKVAALEANKNCSFAFSSTKVFNKDSKQIFIRRPFKSSRILDGKKILIRSFRRHNLFGEPSNVLMRAEAARQAGLFDERLYYSVDWEFWLRLCAQGDACYVDEPLSHFYLRSGSESSKLLKGTKKITGDNRVFVSLCRQRFACLRAADVALHQINFYIRLSKKIAFSLLFN